MKNKFYINFIFILAGVYCLLAALGKLYAPKGEIFPFFHWGLYVTTPQVIEKDFLTVYKNDTVLYENPQPFYELTKDKMSLLQSRFLLKSLKKCINKKCFEHTLKQVNSLLPKGSYSVFYVENEFSKIDTIGIINNGSFILKR